MPQQKTFETYRGCVLAGESDSNNHMNVAYYLTKFEQAGGQFIGMIGLGGELMAKNNWGIVVLEYNIKYFKEVFEDQALHIISSVEKTTYKVFVVKHVMKDSITDEVVSEALCTMLVFDREKRKSVKLPEVAVKRLAEMVGEGN